MIPNLFNMAIGLIGQDEVYLKKFTGNTPNDVGQLVPSYAEPYQIDASFQSTPKEIYSQLGLDLNKHYFFLYTNIDVLELEKGVSSDRVLHNGYEFQILYDIDWIVFNGWKGVLCVRL